jgi:hypothetical protein
VNSFFFLGKRKRGKQKLFIQQFIKESRFFCLFEYFLHKKKTHSKNCDKLFFVLFIHLIRLKLFSDMNKCEQIGAQELLSMLNDGELMSVKDTVTKSMMPTNSVSRIFSND